MRAGSVKVGCCGFQGAMRTYFQSFDLVEVQQTFYHPPSLATVRRWRQEAPPHFEFTVKAWQLVTHPATSPTYRRAHLELSPQAALRCGFFQETEEVWQGWERTREVAEALEARVILFQSPASFDERAEHVADLGRFFTRLERRWDLVWEPRGAWKAETVRCLCAELDLVHAVDPFEAEPLHGAWRYFRLHGGPGYRHRYSDAELAALQERCRELPTYCLFNNLSSFADAGRFQRLLREGAQEG